MKTILEDGRKKFASLLEVMRPRIDRPRNFFKVEMITYRFTAYGIKGFYAVDDRIGLEFVD